MKITNWISLRHQNDISKKLYKKYAIKTLLDLGGGNNPQFKIANSLGIKQLIIDSYFDECDGSVSRRKINFLDFDSVQKSILEIFGLNQVDCVVCIQAIEHLTKEDGFRLLESVEHLSKKLVIFETPNGFVEQGAINGNVHQIHLSGWAPEDFLSRGYSLLGTSGMKFLKKNYDKGSYKLDIRGMKILDVLLSRVLLLQVFPKLNYNLYAYKVLEK